MARFSLGGDEDENEERPSYNRPLPKKPRISHVIFEGTRRLKATAPSSSNASGGATISTPGSPSAPPPPVVPELLIEDSGATEDESEAGSSDASDSPSSDSCKEEESGEEEEEEEQNQRSGNDVQPAEVRVDSTPNGNPTEVRVDSKPNGNGSCLDSAVSCGPIRVILTDTDVLDCPICFDPLCSPVYQCENGHIACAPCCAKIRNKCANCCLPIGYNRCRAMEKVLESVRIGCRNIPRGCKETFSYGQKLTHEKTCNYAPCSCPHLDCEYVGMSKSLYTHFARQHSHSSKQFSFNSIISISLDNTQKHIFLQERSQNTLFILNRSIESFGSFVSIVCIAPTSAKIPFLYELTATAGENSIKLKTAAECMPKWITQPPVKMYLLVPKDFFSSSGQLQFDLMIWRAPALSC